MENLNCKSISDFKQLEIISGKITLFNIDFKRLEEDSVSSNSFFGNLNGFIQLSLLKFLEKVESKLTVELSFLNFEGDRGKLSYHLESVVNHLYSAVQSSLFIENKNVIITFPQYFSAQTKVYTKHGKAEGDSEYFEVELDFNHYTQSDNYASNRYAVGEHSNKLYGKGVMGGSFDHMHLGHKLFLTKAALVVNDLLCIGITSDQMISKKSLPFLLDPYNLRARKVKEFLNELKVNFEFQLYTINDTKGNSSSSIQFEVLILTKETLKGGLIVNEGRKEAGLLPLEFVFSELLSNASFEEVNLESFENKVSSTSIREAITSTLEAENMEKLYTGFCAMMNQINSKISLEFIDCEFAKIRDFYSQSWRRYHNLTHIFDFLEKCRYCCTRNDDIKKMMDPINTQLAIWYHDIIYTPSRKDNEERSRDLFIEFYDLLESNNFNEDKIVNKEKVAKYIMATKEHFKDSFFSDDFNLNVLMDMDVSSMASEEYKVNDENILYEYSHIYDEVSLLNGRINFLNSTLNKPIFKTIVFSHLEGMAHEHNLKLIEMHKNRLSILTS